MRELFVEVVVGTRVADDAIAVFRRRRRLRVVRLPTGGSPVGMEAIRGGFLAQQRTHIEQVMDEAGWKVVSRRPPGTSSGADLRFAWGRGSGQVERDLLARDEAAIGSAPGRLARWTHRSGDPQGAPAGSRSQGRRVSFRRVSFPSDGVEEARERACADHPAGRLGEGRRGRGGRDEADLAMVFTGIRQFRH